MCARVHALYTEDGRWPHKEAEGVSSGWESIGLGGL